MPSADILAFVENFITTVTSFAYSCFFSIWILCFKPKCASRFLKNRLKSNDLKQVGPMTLVFIGVASIFLLFFKISQQYSGEIDKSIFNPEYRKTVTEFIVSCFLVTIFIEGVARFYTILIWGNLDFRGYLFRLSGFNDKRIEISFSMVMPVMAFALLTNCCVEGGALIQDNLIRNISGQEILLLIITFGLLSYFMIRLIIHRSVAMPYFRRRHRSIITVILFEFAVLFSISTTVCLSAFSLNFVSTVMPETKDVYIRADSDDIIVSNFVCTKKENSNVITVSADFFNKNKSSFGILHDFFRVDFSTDKRSGLEKNLDSPLPVDPKASRFIGPGSLTRFHQTFDLGDAYKIDSDTDCSVEWSLTRPSWLFSHQDPFYGKGKIAIID